MSEALDRLRMYAGAGAVVDANVIAVVEAEIAGVEQRLAAAEALLRESRELRQLIGTHWESSLSGMAWIERVKETCGD